MKHFILFLLLSTALSSCKEQDHVLPDITMEGKNTFGCYINGELWVPKGRPSTFQSNFSLTYEPGYRGGTIDIRAFRILNNSDIKGYIQIASSHIGGTGIFNLDDPKHYLLIHRDENCYYDSLEEEVFREGTLEITRLDLKEGIISGKFEFTLAKEGCDTIRVTEGRFDYKL